MTNEYGHKNMMKWVLIDYAPFTASGLNEIIAGATTKSGLIKMAKVVGIRPTETGQYRIIKVEYTKK